MNIIFPQLIVFEIVLLYFVVISGTIAASFSSASSGPSTPLNNVSICNRHCPGGNGMQNSVPYPFGFSSECKIQLICNPTGEIMIGDYVVQNVSSGYIVVDFPMNCSRRIDDLNPLYGKNMGISWRNLLLMQNCSVSFGGCTIPTRLLNSKLPMESCDNKFINSGSVNCYSHSSGNSTILELSKLKETNCDAVFSSVAVDLNSVDLSSAGSLEFATVELSWWLEECDCNILAKKLNFSIGNGSTGCRCQCNDGYVGDGFFAGDGCFGGEGSRKAKEILMPGDELLFNNSIDSSSTLSSPKGIFTLGFFTVSKFTWDTTSAINLTYLGIWYTNEEERGSVWVANRDLPILGVAILIIDNSGILKVKSESGATLFNVSDDKVGSSNNTRAMLQDSGNFIVYDEANRIIWQSFDYPTDTLIPGMKLGYNLTTKKNWELTSWANYGVPTSGAFTMRLEQYQNSPHLLIYRRGELYWASGPWNKSTGTFPTLFNDGQFVFDMVFGPSGMYLIVQTDSMPTLQLYPNGQIFEYTPDFCYGYGYQRDHEGCVDSALPYCPARATDRYQLVSRVGTYYKTDDNSSISLGDCMERCWKDCSCAACSTYNYNGTGCIYWPEVYDEAAEDLTFGQHYVYALHPFKISLASPKNSRWILFSLAIVPVLVLAYVMIKIRIFKGQENRRRDDLIHQLTGGSDSFNYGDELERGIQDAPDVKIFSLKAILAATNNFSDENKLGQGGYGPVYKGKLSDGREIAVKRLSKTSGQGIMEFKSELILISKLQHTNLVRLYGCCIHQEEKMLIYEFMPNKSLDFFLFAQDEKEKIGWQIRFNIIEGVTQGLLYLHKYSRMKVIHRDLKVGNVLLDENMNPKIADFGMARIFQQNVTKAVTNRVVGTYGYMAPEYAMEGTFSIKSDVFSFGVLILEIVSGRRNSSFYNPDRPLNLVGYAWELWKGHASLELKDETLGESYDVKQLLRVIHVGLLCVQENADDRPTMSDVIYILNNENIDLPSPKKPAFFTGRQTGGFRLNEARSTDYLLDRPIRVSEIDLTVTTMEAR